MDMMMQENYSIDNHRSRDQPDFILHK